jgi:hypothetical protein
MRVNICHRLIKNMIQHGENFINNHYGCIISENIPKGLYATKTYAIGDIVKKLEGELVLKPTRKSIHIGNGMHVIDNYGKYINHSFEPNTRIESNNIIAITEINPYDEITFNYNDTELNMAEPFELDGINVCGKKL